MILCIFIINKAGGLIYQKTFNQGLAPISVNDSLVLASTFQSIHAISAKVSPIPSSSGIQLVECEKFRLHCFQTDTGLKFLVIVDNSHTGVDSFIKKIYELYSDYVMKNPFYTLEMPIKCDLFDENLIKSSF